MAALLEYLTDIHPETGEYVRGWARIRASILTILQTRLRTRIMREEFGSEFLNMQDKPLNQEIWMDSVIAAVESINRFEPEFKITTMVVTGAGYDGSIDVVASGVDLVEKTNKTIRETL